MEAVMEVGAVMEAGWLEVVLVVVRAAGATVAATAAAKVVEARMAVSEALVEETGVVAREAETGEVPAGWVERACWFASLAWPSTPGAGSPFTHL